MNNGSIQKKYFWRTLSFMLLFVQFVSSGIFTVPVFAAAPTNIISYQGRLLNSNRAPVSDASASILFELYTLSSGGSCVWSNSSATCASATARTVTLTDGLFSENLGDTGAGVPYAAIGDAIFGDNTTLFLQVTINGETLTPRKQITAAPYALNAQMLDGLDSDANGATSSALVAYNSSGNLVVTGNPGGSTVADGSLYVNPAALDVATDDVLLGVAVGGSSRLRVDAEGDLAIAGDFTTATGSFITSATQANIFDSASGGTRVDIGGVDVDRANTINIATHATSADTITLGNSHVSTTLALTSSTWSVSSLGVGSFSDVTCTDCISFADIVDTDTLDASFALSLGASSSHTITANGSGNIVSNLSGTGSFIVQDGGFSALTIDDSGNTTFTTTTNASDAFTILSSGSLDTLFSVDTRARSSGGNRVKIGNDTGTDGDLTVFVVDGTTADPTTNLASLNGGIFYNATSHKMSIIENGSIKVLCNATDLSCGAGGSSTLQDAYDTDVNGSDAILALTSSDDSLILRNPSSSGTDSTFLLRVDQLAALGVDALTVNNAGTGDIFVGLDNDVEVFTIEDGGRFFSTNASASPSVIDLTGAGDFEVRVGGNHFFEVSSDRQVKVDDVHTVGTGDRGGALFTYSTWDGTYDTGLGSLYLMSSQINVDYQANGSLGSDPRIYGQYINVSSGGTADLHESYGLYSQVSSSSSDVSAVATGLFGVYGNAKHNSSVTIPAAYGVYGAAESSSTGTVTSLYGVYGSIKNGTGSSGSAYGGHFSNTQNGTSRYGVYAEASGGTQNYAGYFSTTGSSGAYGLYILQDAVAEATTSPTAQALVIDVNEAANNDEVILIRSDADGTPDTEFRFENDGDAFADGAWTGGGADYAEFFPTVDQHLDSHDLVCWNELQENGVKRCGAGETDVVGVISTDPGFIGNAYTGAEGNLEEDPRYALVGLVGQIETYVSAETEAIRVGDPLTASLTRAGYAAKALGGTYIIGRALEALPSGTGTIKVLVQPMWYGGDMLATNGEATMFVGDVVLHGLDATADQVAVDSAGLSFVGSSWNGSLATDLSFTLRNAISQGGVSRLSLQNDDGVDVITFGGTGDLALAGNFYPSDRGALQYGAYVYYDSTSAGYMKTNSAGWSSNSSSFSESFPSSDVLTPGDVVEFAVDGFGVVRSSGEAYSDRIAGVVTSRSGFVAGSAPDTYPVVVSGRTFIKVRDENGAISPGDALTTSSVSGFAMKATVSGQVIGYALESLASGEGSIQAFIRPQYKENGSSPAPSSLALGSQDVETLNVSGVLSMNGGDIVNVGTLSGIGTWEIRENGDIVTHGQLTQVVESLQNTLVSTYAITSPETVVQLSGTAVLQGGMARVAFADIHQDYNDIISPEETYRVLVTPNGITGQLYVTDRTNVGFIIRDADGGDGISVDWLVLAYRYDLVPEGETDGTDSETDVTDEEEGEGNGGSEGIEELVSEEPVGEEVIPVVIEEEVIPEEVFGDEAAPVVLESDGGTVSPPEIPESPEIPFENAP